MAQSRSSFSGSHIANGKQILHRLAQLFQILDLARVERHLRGLGADSALRPLGSCPGIIGKLSRPACLPSD
jgi:hypothetical protein